MPDAVFWSTQFECTNITDAFFGIVRDVNGNIDEERTDWERHAAGWDLLAEVPLLSERNYKEEQNNGNQENSR